MLKKEKLLVLLALAACLLLLCACAKPAPEEPPAPPAPEASVQEQPAPTTPESSTQEQPAQEEVQTPSPETSALPEPKPVETTPTEPEQEQWRVEDAMLTDENLLEIVLGSEIALAGENEFTFSDPTELSSQELYMLFLWFSDYKTLEKDCLDEATGEFTFTKDYITDTLSRYFKDYSFDITQLYGYDAARNVVVSKNPSGFGGDRNAKLTEKKVDGAVVTFTVAYYAWEDFEQTEPLYEKTYQVEFYDGGYYYLSAVVN